MKYKLNSIYEIVTDADDDVVYSHVKFQSKRVGNKKKYWVRYFWSLSAARADKEGGWDWYDDKKEEIDNNMYAKYSLLLVDSQDESVPKTTNKDIWSL